MLCVICKTEEDYPFMLLSDKPKESNNIRPVPYFVGKFRRFGNLGNLLRGKSNDKPLRRKPWRKPAA
jgi:hypothetical protein